MEPKKNPKIDYNSASSTRLFFQIGLALTLLATVGLFSFKVYEKEKEKIVLNFEVDDIEMVEATEQEKPKDIPPPPPSIEVVEDDIVVKDTVKFIPPEYDPMTDIPDAIPTKEPEKPKEQKIHEFVEVYPEFPGGEDKMVEFIANLLRYPDEAIDGQMDGVVWVSIVVDENGNVTNVKPLMPKSRQLGYGLEEEAVRVVKKMPRWKPGRQASQNVRVLYKIPIEFKLQ